MSKTELMSKDVRVKQVPHGWLVEKCVGTVAELHGPDVPTHPQPTIRWCVPSDSAVVLGSAQRVEDALDLAAVKQQSLSVVRRRSGGGVVLVEPADVAWFDVIVPRNHMLWRDDVGAAFHWLGQAWAAALVKNGVSMPHVHQGALQRPDHARLVCMLSLGPGEITIKGRKLVGISQRRTKAGAHFHAMVQLRSQPQRLADLLNLSSGERAVVAHALERRTATAPGVDVDTFWASFVEAVSTH